MIYCMRTRIFFPVNNTDYLSCPELSNYRISITRNIADGHGFSFFLFLSRIIEFSNFLFTRNVAGGHGFSFFCPEFSRLVLGPTDQREVIFEFQSHGISRKVTVFLFFFSCPEFSRLVLGPTDRREVIIEFLSSVTFRDIPCD